MRQALLSFGLTVWQAYGLVEDYDHYRSGEAAEVTSAVGDFTGREGIRFSQFARDYA